MINLTEHSSIATLQSLPLWLEGETVISSQSAGASNMNLVLRIQTNSRSIILKQSKSYVRKFPQIPAPIERIEIEQSYYQLIEDDEVLSRYSPKVLGFNAENNILLIEDLGDGIDFNFIYGENFSWEESDFSSLSHYLNALHELEVSNFPDNQEMKKLNHEHLFQFPFLEENGLDLDMIQPGLQEISMKYKTDTKLKTALDLLGKRYLCHGTTLLHGDFYPAAWLKTKDGVKIIDTEFAFMGDSEFDLGVIFAHLDIAGMDSSYHEKFLEQYKHSYRESLVNAFRGMEIMRRIIGIAQLPLSLSLEKKKSLLEKGRKFVLAQ